MEEEPVPGHGRTLKEALENASENAKGTRKGWYHVKRIEVEVQDSIHEYKVLIGPLGPS